MRSLVASIIFCVCGCGQMNAGNRFMDMTDPNLDRTWDWKSEREIEMYSSLDGGKPTRHMASLPFYTPGNTLNNLGSPDMFDEDGWVLVHRDIGTPASAEAFPFFTLYNKYRGIFRVMLFNAAKREGSYFLGELYLLNADQSERTRTPIMTFIDNDPMNCHMEGYNPKMVLSSMSKMTAYSSWAVFDFPLLGYDPDLRSKDPVLVLRLVAIEKQALNLKTAGDLRLYQTVEQNGGYRVTFHDRSGSHGRRLLF